MASSEGDDELNCTICFQVYTEPRILEGCRHYFCENCIVNFVLELKKDEKLGSEFSCPICKQPSTSPGMDDSVHRWVTTLEKKEEIKANSGSEIMDAELSEVGRCCSQCSIIGKNVLADKYCLTCQKDYCGSCSNTLHSFDVTKGHTSLALRDDTMEIGEDGLTALTGFVTCPKHPSEVVTFYCKDDAKFCCAACCVDAHKLCRNVSPVSCLAEQPNIKTESKELQNLIGNIVKHIDNVITTIKENNNENKNKAEQLMARFQEKKQKVIGLLDTMETNLNDEAKAAVKNAALKNQDEIDELASWKRELKSHRQLLDRVVEDASADHAFIGIHEIERKVEEIESQVINKGSTFQTNGLELTTSDTFEFIENLGPNETAQLASIAQPVSNIVVPAYEDRPFLRKHTIEAVKALSIVPHGANPNPDKPDTSPTYGDIIFLPEDRLLLVDSFHGFCCIVSKELSPSTGWTVLANESFPVNFYSNERHATILDESTIAISIASHKTILLVSADGMYTRKGNIKCQYVPKAIRGLNNGDIAVAWDKPVAFGIISGQIWPCRGKVFHGYRGNFGYIEKVYITKDSADRELKSFQFMAIDENRRHVIQPCSVDKVVYCFDMDGNPVFHYSNEQLKDPRGVALDSESNIYICETFLGLIHIISPEGIGITVVTEGAPDRPLAIGFDKDSNKFVVTNDGPEYDEVHFFIISSKKRNLI